MRATERLTGGHRDTICKLLVPVGNGCASLLDERMVNLDCERLELDELWSFDGKKQRQVRKDDAAADRVGDQWTYVAIDSVTRIVPSYLVGKRSVANTNAFVADVASRLRNRVQISTDGLRMYVEAIRESFGMDGVELRADLKSYEADPIGEGRHSPPRVSSVEKFPVFGAPAAEVVSTSYVERQNLTMRMGMRRFTRLTNGFSKKLENHCAAVALHLAHYNFARIHRTLRVTPAMAAGIESTAWDVGDLVGGALERA